MEKIRQAALIAHAIADELPPGPPLSFLYGDERGYFPPRKEQPAAEAEAAIVRAEAKRAMRAAKRARPS